MTTQPYITKDSWSSLKSFTDARIGLGRCGTSLPLRERLALRLAWARARDAVQKPLDFPKLAAELSVTRKDIFLLKSMAESRYTYLMRPDLGRRLSVKSVGELDKSAHGFDLCCVVCDGLSSIAVQNNCTAVLSDFIEKAVGAGLSCSPLLLVENGRVAIGDEIGERLQAKITVLLVGERPGLSAPDSLGVYITWSPAAGTTDEARNCISNIRPGGMSAEDAVKKICYLVEESFRFGLSGVRLKDRMGEEYLPFQMQQDGYSLG